MLEIFEVQFDEDKDFAEVVPDLAIDITLALTTGQIKSTANPLEYSKETNTGEVGSYLRDTIDILQAQKNLNASMSQSKSQAAPAAANVDNATPSGE